VAERPAASQEGLCSTELCSSLYVLFHKKGIPQGCGPHVASNLIDTTLLDL
jgi:hypothetical protein